MQMRKYFFVIPGLILGLFSLCFLILNFMYLPSIERNFSQTQVHITQISVNMTEEQRTTYGDAIFEKLIDWGLQRQITWGVVFLAAVAVLFPTLIEIYNKKHEENRHGWSQLLSFSGFIFSLLASLSVFQIAHYYRYVAYAEKELSIIAAAPTNWIYDLVVYWYAIEIITLVLVPALSIWFAAVIRRKPHK